MGITSNRQLLAAVRAVEPDAYIIFRPHPDVETGLRPGAVDDVEALRHVDRVERDTPTLALVDSVDAVHVLTSLLGFEALLRGRPVVTHGVPFYAGWGLTHDLAPVPPRRGHVRSLDALVAATLLRYPR